MLDACTPDSGIEEGLEELMNTRLALPLALILGSLVSCRPASPPPPPAPQPADKAELRDAALDSIQKGVAFLESRDPKGEGRWMMSAGITAVVLLAHFQSPLELSEKTHPYLWKGLRWLQSLQKPDGAIFNPQEGNSNYVTSVAILAMVHSGDPRFRHTVESARDFLVRSQWTEGVHGGGFGYQDKAKTKDHPYADIVNTEFALEALHHAGLPADHPAWKRAVKYLQSCQHNSEYNKATWVSDIGVYRGGFVYHPGGESKADSKKTADGKEILLPYGSVTYAGIKSMIYAHLSKDDPRVRAAVDWIRKNWTLDSNPGFDIKRDKNLGKQGYFYYFATFAKTLHALGEEVIKDSEQVEHRWREELAARVVSLQKENGRWKNEWHDRWFESHEELATSYAMIALSFALMKKKRIETDD